MNKTNARRAKQLGMSYGAAVHRLRKILMFSMAQKLKQDNCFRCGKRINKIEEFTVEHKENWLDIDPDLFWDLNNIAYSHANCNYKSKRNNNRKTNIHGSPSMYERHKCRCTKCKNWKKKKNKLYREKFAAKV